MTKVRPTRRAPWFIVRKSPVHGLGAFALRRIRKGTRIVEYLGERVPHHEADRRYQDSTASDGHTFLFVLDSKTVIDAGVNGNDARFINHACDPNCESVIERGRVFIEAARTIRPGEELSYDYRLGRDPDDPSDIDEIYACRCGRAHCRGSMLWPPRPGARREAARAKPGKRAGAKRGPASAVKRPKRAPDGKARRR